MKEMNEEQTKSGQYKYVEVHELLCLLSKEINFSKSRSSISLDEIGYIRGLETARWFLLKLQKLPR